jgi:hypothetical protein
MMQESSPRSSGSLKVTVSGEGLPSEVLKRVEHAVQKTVLQELLELNLGPGYRVNLALEPDAAGGDGTQGIVIESELR